MVTWGDEQQPENWGNGSGRGRRAERREAECVHADGDPGPARKVVPRGSVLRAEGSGRSRGTQPAHGARLSLLTVSLRRRSHVGTRTPRGSPSPQHTEFRPSWAAWPPLALVRGLVATVTAPGSWPMGSTWDSRRSDPHSPGSAGRKRSREEPDAHTARAPRPVFRRGDRRPRSAPGRPLLPGPVAVLGVPGLVDVSPGPC